MLRKSSPGAEVIENGCLGIENHSIKTWNAGRKLTSEKIQPIGQPLKIHDGFPFFSSKIYSQVLDIFSS